MQVQNETLKWVMVHVHRLNLFYQKNNNKKIRVGIELIPPAQDTQAPTVINCTTSPVFDVVRSMHKLYNQSLRLLPNVQVGITGYISEPGRLWDSGI